ncbi:hypothetical protein SLEP1_g12497 [Rubroshorea leprosula]|uniref:Uncharacterized protein n=1 Tax=Rubroshorea leprosula TaxID=152421 RepID=A0AAV5ICR8_9ROSI|nr:hypothetical protein SLEP1_g12497 [Rubroshorea leprosula]
MEGDPSKSVIIASVTLDFTKMEVLVSAFVATASTNLLALDSESDDEDLELFKA